VDIYYLKDCQEVIPVLAAWIYDEWSYLYPGMGRTDVLNFLRERINTKRLPITLVAFEAGEPVGTVSLKEFDMETRSDLTPWVTSLYVEKTWRRKRFGSSLMTAIEQKARELEIRRLYLFVTDVSLATLFYGKLGWLIKEETTYHSLPVIILEKAL
jgi:predicted N-acetyltransferase YhbS